MVSVFLGEYYLSLLNTKIDDLCQSQGEPNIRVLKSMQIIHVVPGVKIYLEDNFSILFGAPPEIIKHLMTKNIACPDYVVLPDTIHYRGVLQNATEFILYYHLFVLENFFQGQKLHIMGEQIAVNNNRDLLQLALLGPTPEEFAELDPHSAYYQDLYRESVAISLKDKQGSPLAIDELVNLRAFRQGVIETEHFTLFHVDENIYRVNGTIVDVNFAEEQFPPYDLRPDFVPRMPSKFGLDVLGGSSGFSPLNPCSSLILNYNSEYMLIDCPPFVEYSLNARGISKNQIKSLFLSHIHDDHCNMLPLVLFNKKIQLLCTREIFWMACKKLALMTMRDIEEFYQYFDFVELSPYQVNNFYGLQIIPHYTVHSIPTIGATFAMNCDGITRRIVFVGDNKSLSNIKQMVDSGIVQPKKYQILKQLYRDRYDFFVADGGMGILHGNPRDSLQSQSERVIFLHLEKLPDKFNTTFTVATHGKRFTIKEGSDRAYMIKSLHILNHHYPGISEEWQNTLLNNMQLHKYNSGDVIMKQGQGGAGQTYLIISGKVHIFYYDGRESRKIVGNQAGDVIGEMALIQNVEKIGASIVACTPVTLGEINGEILYSFLQVGNRLDSMKEFLDTRKILERIFRCFAFSIAVNQRIAILGERLPFAEGQIVTRHDESADFYFVLSGEYVEIVNNKEVTRVNACNTCYKLGCFGKFIRNATVKALTDGEVLRLAHHDIEQLMATTPALRFYIYQAITNRAAS